MKKNSNYRSSKISRAMGIIANTNFPRPLQTIINYIYVKSMKIDMGDFDYISNYRSLNELFTRKLINTKRVINKDKKVVISPCDCNVIEQGTIKGDTAVQVKSSEYKISELLSEHIETQNKSRLMDGEFINLYLAPHNYHRYHAPMDLKVNKLIHIPGKLYPVKPRWLKKMPSLYIQNERVVLECVSEIGKVFYMVFVGALNVGKMQFNFDKSIQTNMKDGKILVKEYSDIQIKKGDDLGCFELGSTIVMFFEQNMINLRDLQDKKLSFGDWINNI